MENKFHLIIAGGKTGGHLFPGIAVAQALLEQKPEIRILFVGTDAPFEVSTLKAYGFDHLSIIAKPIKGGSLFQKISSIATLFVSLVQSLTLLKKFKPDFVLGVGGFSSFSLVAAAWILRIPRAIQEQNSICGLTNRMLARVTPTIFTAFETTRNMPCTHKIIHVGNPIRKTSQTQVKASSLTQDIFPDIALEDFVILVTGGSQGASSINQAFIQALELLEDPSRFHIIHQTGIQDETRLQQAYARLKFKSLVQAFFHDIPALQDRADLVISRAGAGAISELTLKGKPTIFVPFPHAADDHQTFNARALEARGAAIVIPDPELTPGRLKSTIEDLMADRKRLKQMGHAAAQLAMPDADQVIAAHILQNLSKEIRGSHVSE